MKLWPENENALMWVKKWKGQKDSLFSHHLVLIIKWLSRHPSTGKVNDISKGQFRLDSSANQQAYI